VLAVPPASMPADPASPVVPAIVAGLWLGPAVEVVLSVVGWTAAGAGVAGGVGDNVDALGAAVAALTVALALAVAVAVAELSMPPTAPTTVIWRALPPVVGEAAARMLDGAVACASNVPVVPVAPVCT
jgi:hypothetical protein